MKKYTWIQYRPKLAVYKFTYYDSVKEIVVEKNGKEEYLITIQNGYWKCNCPARKMCKHVNLIPTLLSQPDEKSRFSKLMEIQRESLRRLGLLEEKRVVTWKDTYIPKHLCGVKR